MVGALVAQIAKGIVVKFLTPHAYKIVKVSDDEEYKRKHAHKAAEYFFATLQYVVVSVWGYTVLRKSKHLPWFMGGQSGPIEAFEST